MRDLFFNTHTHFKRTMENLRKTAFVTRLSPLSFIDRNERHFFERKKHCQLINLDDGKINGNSSSKRLRWTHCMYVHTLINFNSHSLYKFDQMLFVLFYFLMFIMHMILCFCWDSDFPIIKKKLIFILLNTEKKSIYHVLLQKIIFINGHLKLPIL